jgi:hypothetical protein
MSIYVVEFLVAQVSVGWCGYVRLYHVRPGKFRLCQVSSYQVMFGQVTSGQFCLEQFMSG